MGGYPCSEEFGEKADIFEEARTVAQIVNRATPTPRILGSRIIADSTIACATICEGDVDPTVPVDVKVVEIQKIPVRTPDIPAVPRVEADGANLYGVRRDAHGVEDGFVVLPYIHADPTLAKNLEDAGCVTVMPLGSAIGSGQGIHTSEEIKIIIEQANVPVVVDAGLAVPSDAAQALEMGASAVLVNTAIAQAQDPALMGSAFKAGVEAGRNAYLAGRIIVRLSKHYTCLIDGIIHDTHDPSRNGTRCVYGYWIKGEN